MASRGSQVVTSAPSYLPQPFDVCTPKGEHGYAVRVVRSEDDKVHFTMIKDEREHGYLTVRLSTFVSRFELLYRP